MTPELALTLGALALVDSLSIGTLLIPLFLLIAPGRVRVGRMLLYLGTIAGFYFVLGVALTAGAGAIVEGAARWFESPVARWLQLVLGAGLLIGSFFIGRKPKGDGGGTGAANDVARDRGAERADGSREVVGEASVAVDTTARIGRLARWRGILLGDGPAITVVAVALGAGLIEAATMLPYLGAVGLITSAGLPAATWLWVLAAYCAVMIVPALVLLAVRVVARRFVEPGLQRFAAWLQRTSGETTAWIVGIVGFLLFRDAVTALGLFDVIDAISDELG
ncbi:GAP family protein [Agromyces sp. LHK192]|uniref:GAP family protein n=1 Tax=Agromyces sp. LHK192 TaxID=2498704 RepID=UPI000FD9771A|nr:GAP family protein [Agromyces sp. LHK192]